MVSHAAGPVRRWIVLGTVALACWGNLTSCNREKKESVGSNGTAESGKPAPAKKPAATPPLRLPALEQIAKSCALVKVPGQPDRPGILLESAGASSSSRRYLILCDTPQDLESAYVAYRTAEGIEKSSAKKKSTLATGLSVYEFTTKSAVACNRLTDPVFGETWHAIHLAGGGSISEAELASIESELKNISAQRNEMHRLLTESTRARMERRPMGGDPRDPQFQRDPRQPPPGNEIEQDSNATRNEMAMLSAQESKLRSRLQFPISSIAVTEAAAAATQESIESAGAALDNTLLATSENTVRAICRGGKWFDVKELLSSLSDQLEQVTLNVSQSGGGVQLTCELKSGFSLRTNTYSLVAATTFGLESIGSGSLEERLAKVPPVAFEGGGGSYSVSQQLEWNQQKSKLWLKVFDDRKPETPVIDEVILLDYPGSFSARWGKPPSPLIKLPAAPPNTPEDLVKEQLALDAKGEIRDLVAAGDGSVVMVQTEKPPYWAPLDLKTGQWMPAPWIATADTLVATQAGKIYLIDRKTKIVEIWGLVSGKREGFQLLPLEGTIMAAAAPLSDPAQPVMIATDKCGYFVGPEKFEVIPSGLDIRYFFDAEAGKRQGQVPLDPASLCLRASDDGSLYSLSGINANTSQRTRSYLIVTVDRSSMVVATSNEKQFLATRGRNLTQSRGFPDHGGSVTSVMPYPSNARFPGPTGEIRFQGAKEGKPFAVMKNSPVLPDRKEETTGFLVSDRGTYLDSANGVLLLPDGDKLNLVRLNLAVAEKQTPQFIFAGETLEIPLPPGSGHKLTSADGGRSEIGPESIRWFAPVINDNDRNFSLKLEWTGELGSQISKDYRIRVIQPTRSPEVVSPDGRKVIPLHPRVVLTEVDSDIVGFAGSGTVVLVNDSGSLSAWNLITGEMIFRVKKDFHHAFGDADRIYLFSSNGNLTSYDILTGQVAGQAELGDKIQSITTGMSSRDALLAVEHQGVEGFLIQIPRDSLKPNIIDLPQESRRGLFIPQLASNASGSAMWSRGVAIFRDQRAITVKPFAGEAVNGLSFGVPDASGEFVVGGETIVNIGASPLKSVKASTLPGMADSAHCKLDESGRYILVSDTTGDEQTKTVSVRDVREPTKELLKIRYAPYGRDQIPYLISGTNTLVQWLKAGGTTSAVVYDFDIAELTKELSR